MQDYPNNQKYRIIEILGQGGFGSAYKVLNKDNNNIYVIKKILINNVEEEEKIKIKNEATILESLNNPYIVKYYESFSDENSFNIVMEYCNGLDLRKFINNHKEKKKSIEKELIFQIISDICLGIKEIHKNKLIHRDLKPDNLFIGSDLKIKIGDFGISKQLNNYNEYAKSQVGTIRYMAPEIINGEKYNNKVDIWSLGCIIYELCTLNLCFDDVSLKTLMNKIVESKYETINKKIYGADLQNLIDLLLEKDRKKRPDIDIIIEKINKFINRLSIEKKIDLFLNSEIYEEYIIEKDIKNSLDQISINVLAREKKYDNIKEFSLFMAFFLMAFPLIGILSIPSLFSKYFDNLLDRLSNKIFNLSSNIVRSSEKRKFIEDNLIIIQFIKSKISKMLREKLEESLLKEKIIVFNQDNFEKYMQKIQKVLVYQNHIKCLKKISTKNFNILLLGGTNVGKSTLINEFLKLENNKAKEGEGRECETIDFKPYTGKRNNQQYTLYDTNGITLEGKDSIENKKTNIIKEIKERIKKKNPTELIHCIWYCFTGSSFQTAEGRFIKDLLDIYTIYTIPIIFVHTKSFSNSDNNKCKQGLNINLLEIFQRNESKVKEHLENYIKVLARDDEPEEGEEEPRVKAFGLDKLEKISIKEIREKGLKSSYYEFIKENIIDILINGAFNLIFHYHNMKKLADIVTNDIEVYLKTILNILNDDKLKLTVEDKNYNESSLNRIYISFKDIKQNLNIEFKNFLKMDYLKKDNEKFIKEIYENKSDEYKNKINFQDYNKNVENLIYDNIVHNSTEIINNLININFNNYIIQVMKNGIKDQFQQKQEEFINQIYIKLFEDK